jgi:uncharacterized protein with von Willebrand factor type A (vWA) domain
VAEQVPPLLEAASVPVALSTALRRAGVDVPVGATVTFARALAEVRERGVDGAYWAGRSTLLRRPEDTEVFDRCFTSVFGGVSSAPAPVVAVPQPVQLAVDDDGDEGDDDGTDEGPSGGELRLLRFSAHEVLRHKDLATCTEDELAEAHRLMAALRLHPPRRPSRRRRPAPRPRHGAPVDLRRAVRDALRHDGEVVRLATTRRTTRARRVVLLLDVSGSMGPYARALARFGHAAVAGRGAGRVEVFAIGTRLTRITRELSTHDPDAALAAAAEAVVDWDGGTRLGEGLRRFNDEWGVRGLARGAVVVVLSDGWDRGDPDLLSSEVARLTRVAHRLVWVNPLRASPGYQPLARGMAAALPHLDDFVDGHSLASLEALAKLVGE